MEQSLRITDRVNTRVKGKTETMTKVIECIHPCMHIERARSSISDLRFLIIITTFCFITVTHLVQTCLEGLEAQ